MVLHLVVMLGFVDGLPKNIKYKMWLVIENYCFRLYIFLKEFSLLGMIIFLRVFYQFTPIQINHMG